MPEGLEGVRLYDPTDRGVEAELARRLRELRGGEPGGDPPDAPF
jgi:hypothetical protein